MTQEEFQKLAPKEQSRRLRVAAHNEFCKAGTGMDINRMFRCLEEATKIEDEHGFDPYEEECKECAARNAARERGEFTQHESGKSLGQMVREAIA